MPFADLRVGMNVTAGGKTGKVTENSDKIKVKFDEGGYSFFAPADVTPTTVDTRLKATKPTHSDGAIFIHPEHTGTDPLAQPVRSTGRGPGAKAEVQGMKKSIEKASHACPSCGKKGYKKVDGDYWCDGCGQAYGEETEPKEASKAANPDPDADRDEKLSEEDIKRREKGASYNDCPECGKDSLREIGDNIVCGSCGYKLSESEKSLSEDETMKAKKEAIKEETDEEVEKASDEPEKEEKMVDMEDDEEDSEEEESDEKKKKKKGKKAMKGEGSSQAPTEAAANATEEAHTTTPGEVIGQKQDVFVPQSSVDGQREQVTPMGKSATVELSKSPLFVSLNKQMDAMQKAMEQKVDAMQKSMEDRMKNMKGEMETIEKAHKEFLSQSLQKSFAPESTVEAQESFEKMKKDGNIRFR